MGDFEIRLEISTKHGGSVVISRLLIVAKDGEVVLDKKLNDEFIYPEELINLGRWQEFTGFKYIVEVTDGKKED